MGDVVINQRDTGVSSWWQGRQPLWKTFWLLYVGIHVLLALTLTQALIGLMGLVPVSWLESDNAGPTLMVAAGVVVLLLLAFFGLCAKAVWRSSAHHTHPLWRWLARAALLLHALWWLVQLGTMVVLYLYGWEAVLGPWL